MRNKKFLIIGTGAWGTALATVLLHNKQYVKMYGINELQINDLKLRHNRQFFNELKFDKAPNEISNDINKLIIDIDYLLICIPSFAINDFLKSIKSLLPQNVVIINTAKGLNKKDNYFNVIRSIFPRNPVCSLLGPSFAIDVVKKFYTVVNLVSKQKNVLKPLCDAFNNEYFKVLPSNDEIGASYASALKNALAIICGIINFSNNQSNTKSAILTQGIKEINQIMKMMNCKQDSILEFYGIGDILLTCSDTKSRNFSFGQMIAEYGLKRALKMNEYTIEGHQTILNIYEIIKNNIKDFPLFYSSYELMTNKIKLQNFIKKIWLLL